MARYLTSPVLEDDLNADVVYLDDVLAELATEPELRWPIVLALAEAA